MAEWLTTSSVFNVSLLRLALQVQSSNEHCQDVGDVGLVLRRQIAPKYRRAALGSAGWADPSRLGDQQRHRAPPSRGASATGPGAPRERESEPRWEQVSVRPGRRAHEYE